MLALLCLAAATLGAADWVEEPYQLTARPWKPLDIPKDRYLDVLEGLCRYSIRHQAESGAIIDPFLKREHQYATPYFAYAAGTLISEGRARDLLPFAVRAMEHATASFGGGRDSIPDKHGEFFIAALTGALDLYKGQVDEAVLQRWRERMKRPITDVLGGGTNNWETYAMKGEWLRFRSGLVNRDAAVSKVETAWTEHQRERFAAGPFFLYHDRTSDPDTLSVEAVGRGNLLALIHSGYDGPSAPEIQTRVEAATRTALRLQDPSGQTPANGRTDDHVWVDIGYQLAFEVMAERAFQKGDVWTAGQYRRAALLAFQNAQRWRRTDGEWAGSFYVTKNHYDPELRVGYQLASQYSNYNGSLMFHLAEAYHTRKTTIPEQPSPSEIGGYALALDRQFASVVANAGGIQIQANLRGQTSETHGNWWTPLGLVRIARSGWDTRLGPSDGALNARGGVSFAPTFFENGRWVRMADLSGRYEGAWEVEFVHPLLVRCSISYSPKRGAAGPAFRDDLVITPDGVLSTVTKTSSDEVKWGVTWPLLENDGRPLKWSAESRMASTEYAGGGDQQTFLALHDNPVIESGDPPLRSTYGDLRPLRVTVGGPVNRTFVYPRSTGDPSADAVRRSFRLTQPGFESDLGRVTQTTYVGRTSAGGLASELDLDGDGKPDVTLGRPCGFIVQLDHGKVVAMETDCDVAATVQGRRLQLKTHFRQLLR